MEVTLLSFSGKCESEDLQGHGQVLQLLSRCSLAVLQADHCITVDQQWTLDGAARAQDTRAFSPCHMNHSATRYNVARHTLRRQRRVAFYTLRDVQVRVARTCRHVDAQWQSAIRAVHAIVPHRQQGASCLQEGEELLLNYGKTFWTGREDCVIN